MLGYCAEFLGDRNMSVKLNWGKVDYIEKDKDKHLLFPKIENDIETSIYTLKKKFEYKI